MNSIKNHTSEQLLALIKEGDEQAFIELYHRYSGKVRALAFSKVNSKEVTQEIVQEIFSDIWERRRSLKPNNLWNYLAVAVKYQALNHIRQQMSFQKHSNLYKAFLRISEEDTLQSVQYNDLANALEKGVQKLPEKTQLVFRLNRFEGKSIAEIAAKLKLSEKAIKYHISQSLKELRLHLKGFLLALIGFFFF